MLTVSNTRIYKMGEITFKFHAKHFDLQQLRFIRLFRIWNVQTRELYIM